LHLDLAHPDLAHADVTIPQGKTVMDGIAAASDAMYFQVLDSGLRRIFRMPWGSKDATEIKMPFEGNAELGYVSSKLPGAGIYLDGWTHASQLYYYDPATNQVTNTKLMPLGPYDAPDDLTSVEVKATGYDGEEIPLSIVMKKGTVLDGSHPVIMDAYGAYGMVSDPYMSMRGFPWLNRGGILAYAHVRGGGEKGVEWYHAGYKLTKPNTWRDVIACAQYLIDQKYTSASKLAVIGGSAGGITLGRAITSRPDLFGAAWIEAGCVNALRQENSPNGAPNIPEFGSTATEEGFEDLLAMDAVQHVHDGIAYPAVLLQIGMNDPRVAPWQSAKFAARLQAATSSNHPILLRVDYANGHGIGASRKQIEEQTADEYAFFLSQFGINP
jgi:prolyl oligopeptidase